jgi:hypothetical protein
MWTLAIRTSKSPPSSFIFAPRILSTIVSGQLLLAHGGKTLRPEFNDRPRYLAQSGSLQNSIVNIGNGGARDELAAGTRRMAAGRLGLCTYFGQSTWFPSQDLDIPENLSTAETKEIDHIMTGNWWQRVPWRTVLCHCARSPKVLFCPSWAAQLARSHYPESCSTRHIALVTGKGPVTMAEPRTPVSAVPIRAP